MSLFRTTATVLAFSFALQALPVHAQPGHDPRYDIETPPAYAMVGDLLIARPLLIGATVIGAGLFVVSLPFTATGGGVGATGKALVVDPAKAAFVRCLGCTGDGYNKRQ